MPFKSEAQRAYFNANRAKMERQGVDVDEWNAASKGMKLPKRAKGKDKKSGWTSLAKLGHG
jgi:hypothetical protein